MFPHLLVTSPAWAHSPQGGMSFNFFNFNWKVIALPNFVVFCQISTWISHRYTYVSSLSPPGFRVDYFSTVLSSMHWISAVFASSAFISPFFKKYFCWSIVALQCCASFYRTAKWISYMYTYMPSFFWIYFPFRSSQSTEQRAVLFFFFYLIFWPCLMWGLSSLTRYWTQVPCSGSVES